jgi:hypothetical protein
MPSAATSNLLSEELKARLAHLKKLPAGWDGPGSAAVRPEALAQAEGVLCDLSSQYSAFHEPAIIPKFDGTLQLEWHAARRSLEMDLTEAGWEILGEVTSPDAPAFFTADAGASASAPFHPFYEWWTGQRSTWPA